ncbi:hypothetical protein HJ130_18090 [Vibrio parahaemolyticus]|nr:hypothetical protein [Vibrio parahaemolyticus]
MFTFSQVLEVSIFLAEQKVWSVVVRWLVPMQQPIKLLALTGHMFVVGLLTGVSVSQSIDKDNDTTHQYETPSGETFDTSSYP